LITTSVEEDSLNNMARLRRPSINENMETEDLEQQQEDERREEYRRRIQEAKRKGKEAGEAIVSWAKKWVVAPTWKGLMRIQQGLIEISNTSARLGDQITQRGRGPESGFGRSGEIHLT
jgi:hypothetical protein